MKKSFWTLLTGLALVTTLAAAVACTGNPDPEPNPDPDPDPPVVTPDEYAITMGGGGSNRTLDVGQSAEVTWTVTKNDVAVSDEPVTVEVSDDSILAWNAEESTVTALAKGQATFTVSLTEHEDVSASVTYNVTDYFFSREIQRGTVNLNNEENGSVTVTGGQATLVAKNAGTQYVFRATITIPETTNTPSSQSFGVGSFVNNGDNALWFGLQNRDGQNDGKYGVYLRDFYNGWGSATADRIEAGYSSCDVGNVIDFEIIRNGTEYYYSIGGYYGTYSNASYTEATYPGIYSQEIAFTVTDFSVSYDAEEVAAAAAAYADKGPAAVVINETSTRLLRGDTYARTAAVYPASAAEGAQVVWSLDKANMTAGQDGTSIDQTTGALTLAADAEGTVDVIATCGEVSARQTITILTIADEATDGTVTVKGGVRLNDDGSITFPESMNVTDGIGNQTTYDETAYAAYLNNDLTGDFSIEFTVSDYTVNNNNFPKVQISLGEGNNNFYVVYNAANGVRVEAYARGLWTDGKYQEGWYVSEWLNLDQSAAHTFKISVTAQDSAGRYGVYTVTVDGGDALTFAMESQFDNKVTLLRDAHALSTQQPVKFATNTGVSATVSGLKITDGNAVELPTFYSYNANTTIAQDGKGFTTKYTTTEGWAARNNFINGVVYTPEVPADFTLTFDLAFSESTEDSKFIIRLDNWEFHISNKLLGNDAALVVESFADNSWHGENVKVGTGLTAAVRLERQGNAARLIVNDTFVVDIASGVSTTTQLQFWVFNDNASYTDYTVTVSNLAVGAYERAEGYDQTWTYSADYLSNVTAAGFTMRAGTNGWTESNAINYPAAHYGDVEIAFDLAFSAAMTDAKFIVQLGGQRLMINNVTAGITANVVGFDGDKDVIAGAAYTGLKVRIVRTGTRLDLYINDSAEPVRTNSGGISNGKLYFWMFNSTDADADVTATVSNLVVTPNN